MDGTGFVDGPGATGGFPAGGGGRLGTAILGLGGLPGGLLGDCCCLAGHVDVFSVAGGAGGGAVGFIAGGLAGLLDVGVFDGLVRGV